MTADVEREAKDLNRRVIRALEAFEIGDYEELGWLLLSLNDDFEGFVRRIVTERVAKCST